MLHCVPWFSNLLTHLLANGTKPFLPPSWASGFPCLDVITTCCTPEAMHVGGGVLPVNSNQLLPSQQPPEPAYP